MKKILFILIIAILSCSKSPTDKSEHRKSIELEELEASIDSLFHAKLPVDGPGGAIFVSYDHKILIKKGFGYRDVENKQTITQKTNFRTGSISKQFTALSILSLVDQGLLSLNDSIYQFWPYPVFKDITIEHLLNHSSGLADYDAHFTKNWNRDNIVENKDILDWLSTNPTSLFKPGTDFDYSNTGYIVLAQLVETVSGEPFATYAQNNIFKKSGMENTSFYSFSKSLDISERAYCYEKDSLGIWKKVDGYFMNGIMGGGGMYTNIDDYFNYITSLDSRTILSTEMHDLIFKPNSVLIPKNEGYEFGFLNEKQQQYAMGWFVTDKIALHGGSWNGTRAMVVKELEEPLTIVIFLNFDSSKIRNELTESVYSLVKKYLTTTSN